MSVAIWMASTGSKPADTRESDTMVEMSLALEEVRVDVVAAQDQVAGVHAELPDRVDDRRPLFGREPVDAGRQEHPQPPPELLHHLFDGLGDVRVLDPA